MELLTVTVLLTIFLCSNAQSPPVVAPADCSDAEIERDAGRALDLINKHRREGYVFTLLRVADAHVQHAGNVSLLYFTLDVVDTECPVLSRKEWSSCRHRVFYRSTEFGRCKAVLYKNSLFKKEELLGYNCTMSPVPAQLYECKDCVVKVTNLLDVESYTDEANKILEKHRQESNETRGFRVAKVEKTFSMVGSRKGHHVEFTITEADCPKAGFPKNASECSFPPKRHGHMGFCIGRVVQELEIVEVVSCTIYDIPHGKHPFYHHHVHNDAGEFYHCCNVSGEDHGPPPPGPPHKDQQQHHQRHHHHHHRPHNHHRHSHGGSGEFYPHYNVSGQDRGPPPPGPPHKDQQQQHHDHLRCRPHNHHCHSHDSSGEFHPRCNVSGQDHGPPPPGPPHKDQQQQHHDHLRCRPHNHHRHSHDGSGEFHPRCNVSGQDRGSPPPGPPHKDHQQQQHHDHLHRRPHHHHRHAHDGSGEFYHRCNMSRQEERLPPPGPPHTGHHSQHRPRHHHRPSHDDSHCNMCAKESGLPPSSPPQRDDNHHHHPPYRCHHCQPSCPPHAPCDHTSSPRVHRRGHHPHHHFHDRRCKNTAEKQGGFSSEDHGSFQPHHPFHHSDVDSVYYIPVLSQDDALKNPGANFLDRHPCGPHRRSKKWFSSCRHTDENPAVQPFPEIPSKSKCPGNLKFEPPKGLLLLYPPQLKH